ncbi:MAG: transposase [Chloroflexi bacterium]|nr:transposase [Chloroflexota bacterium]
MESYRIVEGIGLYFITFTIVEWLPVFVDDASCKIITDSLNFSIDNKHLRVNAYVIMPNHFHAIVFDAEFDAERLKHTLDDIRKFTGRRLADYCVQHKSPIFTEAFRKHAGKDRKRRFWQPTQHPEGIFTEKFWAQKMNYIHWNPVRKGLVRRPEDWRFSSAAFWLTDEEVDVRLSAADW